MSYAGQGKYVALYAAQGWFLFHTQKHKLYYLLPNCKISSFDFDVPCFVQYIYFTFIHIELTYRFCSYYSGLNVDRCITHEFTNIKEDLRETKRLSDRLYTVGSGQLPVIRASPCRHKFLCGGAWGWLDCVSVVFKLTLTGRKIGACVECIVL